MLGSPLERGTRLRPFDVARASAISWLNSAFYPSIRKCAHGDLGFGGETLDALRQRTDFLIEKGPAERRGQRVILVRNLLPTLRGHELVKTAQDMARKTGLKHRPVADRQLAAGVYRRSVGAMRCLMTARGSAS